MADVKIEVAKAVHRDGVMRLIENVFSKLEPIEAALDVPWGDVRADWERIVDDCLKHPHSHVAVTPSNIVVGFRLSRVIDLDTFSSESIYEWLVPPALKDVVDQMTATWSTVLKGAAGTQNKKILQFMLLCVEPQYGGRGYARRMCEENMANAKRLGCSYCTVVATNWISQRVFDKLSFRVLGEVTYSALRDRSGNPPFVIPDPKQKGAKWYGKKL